MLVVDTSRKLLFAIDKAAVVLSMMENREKYASGLQFKTESGFAKLKRLDRVELSRRRRQLFTELFDCESL